MIDPETLPVETDERTIHGAALQVAGVEELAPNRQMSWLSAPKWSPSDQCEGGPLPERVCQASVVSVGGHLRKRNAVRITRLAKCLPSTGSRLNVELPAQVKAIRASKASVAEFGVRTDAQVRQFEVDNILAR